VVPGQKSGFPLVATNWKMQQQKCIVLHSTDSKIRGNFAATKEALKTRDTAQFM
jgi:hypothetical protein